MDVVRDDDAATGRRFLTRSAYADDRHLKSRQAIFAYADARAGDRPRTSFVDWDGTQVAADVGCGNGFDLRRLVPDGRGSLSEMHELLSAAVSTRLGRSVQTMPALSFTTETGQEALGREFSEVTLHNLDVPLSFPRAGPVTAYLDSLREPILAHIAEPFDFGAALAEVAARVDHIVGGEGRFRVMFRAGVFVCR